VPAQVRIVRILLESPPQQFEPVPHILQLAERPVSYKPSFQEHLDGVVKQNTHYWHASRMHGKSCRGAADANQIIDVDISPYLLREAEALTKQAGLANRISFEEGHAEAMPMTASMSRCPSR
jgi:hypothetical protein